MGAQVVSAKTGAFTLIQTLSDHNGRHEGHEGDEGDEGHEGHEGHEGDEEGEEGGGASGRPQGHEEEVISFAWKLSIEVISSFRTSAAETSRVATLQSSLHCAEMYLECAVS